MKRGILAVSVVLGIVLYSHRSGLHEIFTDVALGAASLAGLCLATAGLAHLVSRRPAKEVRQRTVTQPAVVVRQRADQTADRCRACGQPATRMFEDWLVCDECDSRLAAAAAHEPASQRPDYPRKTADLAAAYGHQPADDLPALTQPPVIPNGETIGQVDMTDFENRGTL